MTRTELKEYGFTPHEPSFDGIELWARDTTLVAFYSKGYDGLFADAEKITPEELIDKISRDIDDELQMR